MDAQDAHGNTALHCACSHGNLAVCRCLVKHGADPDARNSSGHTPLWVSVKCDDPESRTQRHLVSFLLDHGANLNASETDSSGTDFLTHAVTHGDHATAALVLANARAKGVAVRLPDSAWLAAAQHATISSPLLKEMPADSPAAVAALCAAWQRQKSRDGEVSSEQPGMSEADLKAVPAKLKSSEASALLKRMCKGESCPNASITRCAIWLVHCSCCLCTSTPAVASAKCMFLSECHPPALRAACRSLLLQSLYALTVLPDAGGKLGVQDDSGATVLHSALQFAGLSEVMIIVNAGGAVSTATREGDLPLHVACRRYAAAPGLESLLGHLVTPAVNINACDADGVPAICWLAAAANMDAVAALLAKGANANAADAKGCNCLHWLASSSIKHVAAVKAGGDTGSAPAHTISGKHAAAGERASLFQALKAVTRAFADALGRLVVRSLLASP